MNNITVRIAIQGMGCASCVAKIEHQLRHVDGIEHAHVHLADRTASIEKHPHLADEKIIQAVAQAGAYQAIIMRDEQDEADKVQREQHHLSLKIRQSYIAGLAGLSLMFSSMMHLLPELTLYVFWWPVALFTLFIMAYAGGHFYQRAWQSLKHHHATMDTLVALGTGVAWLYSLWVVLMPEWFPLASRFVYFEAALIVIALVNVGHVLEAKARGRTNQTIRHLFHLQVQTARIIEDGKERDMPIQSIMVGDVLRVRPGEKIAVDGVVIEGHGLLNESMLTGEAMPVTKTIADEVVAGTINENGSFLYQAQRIGQDTILAHMIETVRRAQSSKPNIARLVDQVAAVFVPIVLFISLCTAAYWWFLSGEQAVLAVVTAMSVLLIACPCALGLATPISMVVGIGKAAEHGILIRHGQALECAAHITTVVLDKTGTITQGKPVLSDIIVADDIDEHDVVLWAASLEQGSAHPLAQAFLQAAAIRKLPLQTVTEFDAIHGGGVQAKINDDYLWLGHAAFLGSQGLVVDAQWQKQADNFAKQGKTPVFLAKNEHILALMAITDPIQEHAQYAIEQFHRQGLRVLMLTGDNLKTAQAVAAEVGIQEVIAEVKPDEKDAKIAQLQAQGAVVAMVGDGINDAAALARADVGFAVAHGSDIAIESADVVLMRSNLLAITSTIAISKATLRNIRQNLWGAFIYNSLAIPVAAGVLFPAFGILLNPMFAGAAMAMSSFTVVSNANRLRFFTLPKNTSGSCD